MKKVLFEQMTNILLVIFLAIALIQAIPTVYLNGSKSEYLPKNP